MSATGRARRTVFGALRRAVAPPPVVRVSEWAGEFRYVAGDASTRPGRWDNDLTPYLVDVMNALSFDDPCREVVFKKSAQLGASEVGLNWLGSIIHRTPMATLVALPKHGAVGEFGEDKLDKMIQATPEVRRRVAARTRGSAKASTTRVKRFRGGSIRLVNAASSADLQSKSVRALFCDEVTEYPPDVKGMGDPVAALRQRTEGYARERKIFFVSTPGLKGACRISAMYEASDKGLFYVPCPHCSHYQPLRWANMKWRRKQAPYGAYMVCQANGCIIEPTEKRGMLRRGAWVRRYDGGEGDPPPPEHFPAEEFDRWRARRNPHLARGFHAWRAYSPFSGWDDIVREYLDSKGDPQGEKQFTLKVLAEEYEQVHDLPAHQVLHQRREDLPVRRLPPWCLFLTGATDVQDNRLEWAVYGWDRHFAPTWIDGGVLIGDAGGDEVWTAQAGLLRRSWADAWGRPVVPEAWGIDTGGHHTHRVYRFVRPYAHQDRPKVMALKGMPNWGRPPIGSPSVQVVNFQGRKVGEVQLWPVGTWDLKAAVSRCLRLTEQGPDGAGIWPAGAARFPMGCDLAFFEQLTAEACVERRVGGRHGRVLREWVRLQGRPNEQLDLKVYAMALAHHVTEGFTPAMWDALAHRRQGPAAEVQPDMAHLWSSSLAAEAQVPEPGTAPEPETETRAVAPHVAARGMAFTGRRLMGTGRSLR